jgi:hypothetical protein
VEELQKDFRGADAPIVSQVPGKPELPLPCPSAQHPRYRCKSSRLQRRILCSFCRSSFRRCWGRWAPPGWSFCSLSSCS